MEEPDNPPYQIGDLNALLRSDLYKTLNLFAGNYGSKPYDLSSEATIAHLRSKIRKEYPFPLNKDSKSSSILASSIAKASAAITNESGTKKLLSITNTTSTGGKTPYALENCISKDENSNNIPSVSPNTPLMDRVTKTCLEYSGDFDPDSCLWDDTIGKAQIHIPNTSSSASDSQSMALGGDLANLRLKVDVKGRKPVWHPPWKLHRVIIGHQGWVNCVDVDPSNLWFATGSNDRLIKIWDLATCQLKLSLTGHINAVRDLKISKRHPYLFSCGEDNRVKCWDLEQNKVVRDYHGHLSGVYAVAIHPALDILVSGGRDAVVRVWDMRTKRAVHVLGGHTSTVHSLAAHSVEPQIISGSQDKTVRLWDLAAGRCKTTLTHHKKSIRALAIHPREYSFVSCSADNNKVWRLPNGIFDRNVTGHNAIVNTCAIKDNGYSSVLVCGTDNGQLHFWDWTSGYKFQTIQSQVQKGSLESESAIFGCKFDYSETRLITTECDKTIKVWIQDKDATEESFPIEWKPPMVAAKIQTLPRPKRHIRL